MSLIFHVLISFNYVCLRCFIWSSRYTIATGSFTHKAQGILYCTELNKIAVRSYESTIITIIVITIIIIIIIIIVVVNFVVIVLVVVIAIGTIIITIIIMNNIIINIVTIIIIIIIIIIILIIIITLSECTRLRLCNWNVSDMIWIAYRNKAIAFRDVTGAWE